MKNHKNVLVFGGTGFVGTRVVQNLIDSGFNPILITRKSSTVNKGIKQIEGSLEDLSSLKSLAKPLNPDCIIYLIGIIKENPKKMVTFNKMHFEWAARACELAQSLNIERILFMSANGASEIGTPYQISKSLGESSLKKTKLNWTIFRPSIIADFDSKNYNFFSVLASQVKFLIVPVFGDGTYKMTPVVRSDVAKIFVQSINSEKTFKKTYEVGGEENITYNDMLIKIAKSTHKHILPLHIPLNLSKIGINLFQKLPFFPITLDQLTMLTEGNTVTDNTIWKDLSLQPTPINSIFNKYEEKNNE
ncbi:MAG: NAD(P)H-binding protein [Candidatus Levybacteria bacterium]|nr:NAD(P)H-binding protein [Candidatus Levybacteria bacterium]